MKRIVWTGSILLSFLLLLTTSSALAASKVTIDNADIVGAGATFPAPLYQRWISEFGKTHNEFSLYYDAVGSGAGTKRFMAGMVDFGASDSAMKDKRMAEVKAGVQLIPATAGLIVLGYHIPDLNGELKLSREVYTDIFLGKIRYWDDERIKTLNPGLNLPRLNIVTVTRSDSSGTTWAFTNHLNSISKAWGTEGPGVGKKVDWPGNSMAGRYNEGVAVKISHSWGAIGYVEYNIAKRAGLSMAVLENKAGNYVSPSGETGSKTLADTAAAMPENLRMFLPDPDGASSYPIITYSWLLLYKQYSDKLIGSRVKEFTKWALTDGQQFADETGYVPLPASVTKSGIAALNTIQ